MADAETTDRAPAVDPEVEARRQAALKAVRQWGDPALKTPAREVTVFDDGLREELETMGRLMHDARGVGLAANQVGTLHRVLVYAVDGGAGPVRALVNPAVQWRSDDAEVAEEGCLSLRGALVDVERSVHLVLEAQDGHGESISVEASGFEARVIQHEMDHLDGILILDRAPRAQRKQAAKALRSAYEE